MFIGEIRKVIRNKMFIVIMFAVLAANIITIIYLSKDTSEFYYYVKNKETYEKYLNGDNDIDDIYIFFYESKEQKQKEYTESYSSFIADMAERGNNILLSFSTSEDSYLSRNVKKTSDDYKKLEKIQLETEINCGMEEYASYIYGIFFMILMSFILVDFLYFQERRNCLLGILKTTKRGRLTLAFTKWKAGVVVLSVITFLQEIITVSIYNELYGIGSWSGYIQSLKIFRDCAYYMTNIGAIFFVITMRIIIAVVIFSLIYMFAMIFDKIAMAVVVPCVILLFEYVLDNFLMIEGSFDKLKTLNPFYAWKMSNSIGVYHNLDILGKPFDKNSVFIICGMFIMGLCLVIGVCSFGIKYQSAYKKKQIKLLVRIRRESSKLLHTGNIAVNEIYKLLLQQKKWIIVALLTVWVISNRYEYVPNDTYQTAYEASYHMYLSNIKGKCTNETITYIDNQTARLEELQNKMEEARRVDDTVMYLQLSAEYESMREGYDRMMAQFEHLKSVGKFEDKYFIDELFLNDVWYDYEGDLFIFLISCVVLIMLLAGLYTADVRYMTEKMIYSTKMGRNHLQSARNICSAVIVLSIAILTEVPKFIAYRKIIETECLAQPLSAFYEPVMDSSMTLLTFLLTIFICKLLLFSIIAFFIIGIARKTKNELLTSTSGIVGIILATLILYYLQTDITVFLIQHI